jgi:uncharacterized peroxidase-related enzyme
MAHIELDPILPGIRGLFALRPETAKPLSELAHILLHEDNSLSKSDRELIATYVSHLNDCFYCQTSHGAIAAYHLKGDDTLVAQVKNDVESAPISNKLRALLKIAAKVQKGGKSVSEADVAAARNAGAIDIEIHDTVLIAAAFCMYNRYVDGLATWAPPNPIEYKERAAQVAEAGYMRIPADIKNFQLRSSGRPEAPVDCEDE